MQVSLVSFRAVRSEFDLTYLFSLLGETLSNAGRIEEGLAAVAEAFEVLNRTGECRWEAELYRLKGDLMLKAALNTSHNEAENCYHKAVETAQRQSAKSLELRAVMSLARLWQQQGKHTEARQMLAEIYGWFTEGFDTADLQDAKALLEELDSELSL